MIGMAIILGRFIIAFYTISHEIICLTTITGEIYGISPEKKEDFLNVLKKYKNSIEIIQ